MLTDEQIKSLILYKLLMRKCWGGKHTSFDNLKKGVKVQELGKEGLKRIDKMGKELIRCGMLLTKPTMMNSTYQFDSHFYLLNQFFRPFYISYSYL